MDNGPPQCLDQRPTVSVNHLSPAAWEMPLPGRLYVLYARLPGYLKHCSRSHGDGSHLKALARLSRLQLLIIDDFLLTPLIDSVR